MKIGLTILLVFILLFCVGCSLFNMGVHKSPELFGQIIIPKDLNINYDALYWEIEYYCQGEKNIGFLKGSKTNSCGNRSYKIKLNEDGTFKLPSATFISSLSSVYVNFQANLYIKGQASPLFNSKGDLSTRYASASDPSNSLVLTLLKKKYEVNISEQSITTIFNHLSEIKLETNQDTKIKFNYSCGYFYKYFEVTLKDLLKNKTIGFDDFIAVPLGDETFTEEFSIDLATPSQSKGVQNEKILSHIKHVTPKDLSIPMVVSLDNTIIMNELLSLLDQKFSSVKLVNALQKDDLNEMKKLLELGADPDYINDSNYNNERSSLIYKAVEKQNYDMVKLLLDAGADVMNGGIGIAFDKYKFLTDLRIERSEEFKKAEKIIDLMFLHMHKTKRSLPETHILCDVLEIGRLVWAKKLVDTGVSVNDFSPLRIAAEQGYLGMVQYLVKNGAITEPIDGKPSPIYLASKNGHYDIVKFLLDLNNDKLSINIALHGIIERGDLKFLEYLMSKKPDIEFSYPVCKPLKRAVETKNIQIVKLLIAAGADVAGSGALALSVEKKDRKLFQYLITKEGADAYQKSIAMNAAIDAGDIEFVKDLIKLGVPVNKDQDPISHAINGMKPNILRLLVENGADINKFTISSDKLNYVHLMVLRENIEGLQMVIDNGANVKLSTLSGETPLHLAAEKNFDEAISLLIKNGADINAKTDSGLTPLHIAAKDNNFSAVKQLVEMGANLSIVNWKFDKPVHFAHGKVKDYLLLKMGKIDNKHKKQ